MPCLLCKEVQFWGFRVCAKSARRQSERSGADPTLQSGRGLFRVGLDANRVRGNEISSEIREERFVESIHGQRDQVDFRSNHPRLITCVRDDFALRIDDETATGVVELGIGTDAIDPGDPALVLNGPGLQEFDPMGEAGVRPAGDISQQLGACTGCRAGDFGKTQVIANEGRDETLAPLEKERPGSGVKDGCFAAGRKRLSLGVPGDFSTRR